MTPRDQVLEQALSLAPEDRAYVVAALEKSLASSGSPDALTLELQRRSAAYKSGASTARAAEEVLRDQWQDQSTEG